MNGFGVNTKLIYRGDQILRGFDKEIRDHVAEEMIKSGISISLNADVAQINVVAGGLELTGSNGKTENFEKVLAATGRTPNSDDLGLENLGIKIGRIGEISVDDYSQSSSESVYAIGDVTNRSNLTPIAIREAMSFIETVFKGKPEKLDYRIIPTAVFTTPEIGTVGLTEEEASEFGPLLIYTTKFKSMRDGFAGREDQIFMKFIVEEKKSKGFGLSFCLTFCRGISAISCSSCYYGGNKT